MLAKLRGGMAELRVKTGRWNGLKKEERICKRCTMGKVENEEHFLLRCEGYAEERLIKITLNTIYHRAQANYHKPKLFTL